MPRPSYIICCQSGAIDRETNQVSHFNVIEKLGITIERRSQAKRGKKQPVMLARIVPFQIVAMWMLNEDDKVGEVYESEIAMKRPEDDDESIGHKDTFKFERQFQRFVTVVEMGPREDAKSGVLIVRSRIRKAGTKSWLQQECIIPVEVTIKEASSPESTNGKARKKKK